jgi:hypothetical protein
VLTRLAAVGGVVATSVLVSAWPAAAGQPPGPVVVSTDNHGGVVDTTVTTPGHAGGAQTIAASRPAVTCHSVLTTNYKTNMPMTDTRHGVFGVYYLVYCSDGSASLQWVPKNPQAGATRATPATLAKRAVDHLPLPSPIARHNPSRVDGRSETIVGVQTWWWVSPASFQPISHTVRAGATWARVTAQPIATYWASGSSDAPNVTCDGPGTPYDESRSADEQHTDCYTVYSRSSADQPQSGPSPNDRYFIAAVTVTWRVTWVGAGGASGALPTIRRRTTFPIAVGEVQTVNN